MEEIITRINNSKDNIKDLEKQKQELINEYQELVERIQTLEKVNAKDLEKEQAHSLLAIVVILATTILSVGTRLDIVVVQNVTSSIMQLLALPAAVTTATICALVADINYRKMIIRKEYGIKGNINEEISGEKQLLKYDEEEIKKIDKKISRSNIEIEVLEDLLKSIKVPEIKKENTNSFQIYTLKDEKKLSRTKTR